jgi:hypothetical protein
MSYSAVDLFGPLSFVRLTFWKFFSWATRVSPAAKPGDSRAKAQRRREKLGNSSFAESLREGSSLAVQSPPKTKIDGQDGQDQERGSVSPIPFILFIDVPLLVSSRSPRLGAESRISSILSHRVAWFYDR